MLNLRKLVKDYEDSARSFNELVPWMAQIAPNLILNKDGSLLAVFRFSGQDAEGKEQYEVDHAAGLIEHAKRVFNDRYTIWYTVDRRRTRDYVGGEFQNDISAYVNAIWRDEITSGAQFTNQHHMAVLYSPPKGIEGAFEKIAHFLRDEEMSFPQAIAETIKSSIFKRAAFAFEERQLLQFIDEFETAMLSFSQTAADLNMHRLTEEELLGYLHFRCNYASQGQKVRRATIPIYLDSYIPADTLVSRDDVLIFRGPEKTACISGCSIKDWPDVTAPGLLDELLAVPGEITFSQVFRIADSDKARSYIESVERHNRNMTKSLKSRIIESFSGNESDKIDYGRLSMADDAREAITEMTTMNRAYGYYNLTVLACGESRKETEETMKMVTQVMRQRMFVVIREGMHLLSAFAGTMPGQAGALVRWFFVSGANVSDLAPMRTLSIGEPVNKHFSERMGYKVPAVTMLPTEFNTPYYFNFHQADLAHTMVIGPSRTGKSAFDNFLISQFQKYSPSQTFIFDKDYSCRIPTLLQDGDHIDLAGDHDTGSVKLNPLMLLENEHDWPWLAGWICMLLTSRGYEMSAEDDKLLWHAIERLASQPRSDWNLRMLSALLDARHLCEQLQQWIGSGQKARFFDNDEDTFSLSSFTCIEMNRLFQDEQVARAFMEYAFYRILKKLDGRPTLIYIEEAWFMLAEPRFAARLDDWLRTLAKKNAFLMMATQSLAEVADSKIFSTLIDNIPNRIFLANPNALAHVDLYTKKFSLNKTQVERIRTAQPKLHYYIVTPKMSRMVEVRLPAPILAVVRSDDRAQAVFNRHYEPGAKDGRWKERYMAEMLQTEEKEAA